MPPQTRSQQTEQAPEQAPEQQAPAPEDTSKPYVVLTSTVVYGSGPKPRETRRAVRGQVVKIDARYTDVERLVALGAIALHDGEPKTATSALAAAKAAGAADDPIPAPVTETVPIDPTAEQLAEENDDEDDVTA